MQTFSTELKPTSNRYASFRGKTRAKQIEFMWHLYKHGLSAPEIAKVYGITTDRVHKVLSNRIKKQML